MRDKVGGAQCLSQASSWQTTEARNVAALEQESEAARENSQPGPAAAALDAAPQLAADQAC